MYKKSFAKWWKSTMKGMRMFFFVMLCIPFCKHKLTSIDARLNMMCVI